MKHIKTSNGNLMVMSVLLLFFLLGVLYVYYTPLWTPADEERHFAYCQYIAKNRSLPTFSPDFYETTVYMAFHPPLYYLIGSLFCRPDAPPVEEEITVNQLPGPTTLLHPQNQITTFAGNARSAYVLRLLSLVLGAITIIYIYKAGVLMFHGRHAFAALAAFMVAMNPQFTHVFASISNETLSTTFATVYIFSLLRYLRTVPTNGSAVVLGVLLGCSLVTKTSSFFLAPLTVLFFLYLIINQSQNAFKHLLLVIAISAAISAWWYLRNWIVYDDPFFAKTMASAHPWSVRSAFPPLADIKIIFVRGFISYFGFFGGQKVPIGWPHLICYAVLMVAAATGFVRYFFKPGVHRHDLPQLMLMILAALGGLAFFALFNIKYFGAYQGRYLFVAIGPITLLTCLGLATITPAARSGLIAACIAAGLVLLNASALFFVLRPGYTPPRIAASVQQEFFDDQTPAITSGRTVGQSFISPADNLCGIEVLFATTVDNPPETLLFTLAETDHQKNSRVLHTIRFSARTIRDFTRYYFAFPPVADSAGKHYTFSLEAEPGHSNSDALGLWHSRQDMYSLGTLLINEQPEDGDIYFRVYSFTGDRPAALLEGSRPHAYNQGLYLDIWELQLYQQQSQTFRLQTHSHAKLLQLQAAISNRGNLQ